MFGFSPPAFLTESLHVAPTPPSHPQYATFPFDSSSSSNNHQNHTGQTIMTPGGQSQASSSHTAGAGGGGSSEAGSIEKDPFLSLLEQLAENEQNSAGGPSELDFFLGGVDVEVGEKE